MQDVGVIDFPSLEDTQPERNEVDTENADEIYRVVGREHFDKMICNIYRGLGPSRGLLFIESVVVLNISYFDVKSDAEYSKSSVICENDELIYGFHQEFYRAPVDEERELGRLGLVVGWSVDDVLAEALKWCDAEFVGPPDPRRRGALKARRQAGCERIEGGSRQRLPPAQRVITVDFPFLEDAPSPEGERPALDCFVGQELTSGEACRLREGFFWVNYDSSSCHGPSVSYRHQSGTSVYVDGSVCTARGGFANVGTVCLGKRCSSARSRFVAYPVGDAPRWRIAATPGTKDAIAE